MAEEKKNPGNPGHVTPILCEAYREAITAKIDSIKTIIVISVSVSTAFISIVMWLLDIGGT